MACLLVPTAQAKSLHPDFQLLRGEVQQYGDWLAGCDNNAECTMIGFPDNGLRREPDGAVFDMAIQISLKGEPGTDPVVELVPVATVFGSKSAAEIAGPFVFNIAYDVAAVSLPHGFSRQVLFPMEASAVIRHLSLGRRLHGTALSSNMVVVRLPYAEFKRAFTALQNRHAQLMKEMADTAVEDLPGELPDGSNMPIPGKLKRIGARETMVSGFVPILAEGRCKNEFMSNPRQYHFANGAVLWSFECTDARGSPRTLWDMAPNANAIATPLDLPEPRDRKVRAGVDGLEGVAFDWDFGIVRSYEFQNGREDCGTFRAWGYTTNGWHMIERREMPLCKGLTPDQWIRTHYTPTDGAGADE